MPTVAVDQVTGTVGVMYYDSRWDPALARAATSWPHMFLTLSPTYVGLAQAAYDFTVAYLRIASFDFRVKIAAFRLRLEKRIAELDVRAERLLHAKRERWQRLALQLQERGPLKVLERGYAIATDAAGNLLRDAAHIAVGETVSIQLHRGRLSTEVKKKEGG